MQELIIILFFRWSGEFSNKFFYLRFIYSLKIAVYGHCIRKTYEKIELDTKNARN